MIRLVGLVTAVAAAFALTALLVPRSAGELRRSVIGIAPRAFAYTALGSSFAVGRLDSTEAVVAVALLAGLAVHGVLLLMWERRRARDHR